jgi:hypothetical protein
MQVAAALTYPCAVYYVEFPYYSLFAFYDIELLLVAAKLTAFTLFRTRIWNLPTLIYNAKHSFFFLAYIFALS